MNIENSKIASKQIKHLLETLEIKKPVNGDAAVFFDIDGTVSRNDNLELLITEITRRDLLSCDKEVMVERARKLWKNRELDFKEYLDDVINLIPSLKCFSYEILHKIAQDVVEGQGASFYFFPWLLLIKLKNLGYKLIAVSGAPSFMAQMYLNKIGLFPWKIHSSEWIFENDVFTGDIDLTILKHKGAFIEKEYEKQFDLKKCIALGDTVSDVSMLKKVGKSIVINPTYALAEEAKKQAWPIVLERKDLLLVFPDGKLNN